MMHLYGADMKGKDWKFHRRGRGNKHVGHGRLKQSKWLNEIKGRRGSRIDKGDTRYLILDTLKEKDRHGYDIMQTIEEKTAGLYRPSPGSIYPALQNLEEQDLITVHEEGKRKVFSLTDRGREELKDNTSLLDAIYEDFEVDNTPEEDEFLEEMHAACLRLTHLLVKAFQVKRLNIKDNDAIEKIRCTIEDAVKSIENQLTDYTGDKQ